MTRTALTLVLVASLLASAGTARAAAADSAPPTVFDSAYQGLLVGGLAGVATGYLFARRGGWDSSKDWKPLAYGAGIGALAGATLGLTLGIVDVTQRHPGRDGYVMRDGLYGAGLGAVLGGIAGGLGAISSGKGEHILLGGSIGVLAGACLGMTVGFIEGYRKQYAVSTSLVQQADGSVAFLPAVVGRF
jgi:hypothetical protein